MKLKLISASGRLLDTVSVTDDACRVSELKKTILLSKVALRPHRQRLTLPKKAGAGSKPTTLEDNKALSTYGLKEGDSIVVKDLGPQISWRAVFCIEYLGPLLIHQLFFLTRFNSPQVMSFTQILAYACVSFHFLKREYETFFIHRFSHSTMPLRNLFKNCGHYWILSGALISYYLYAPSFRSPSLPIVIGSLLVFMGAEIGNFYTHAVLRNLRPEGTTRRGIPHGIGFTWVSCPNYTFEIIAWMAFATMTSLWAAWLFTVVASVQMFLWAAKKHSQYRHEFPDYPRNRKILIPFIL